MTFLQYLIICIYVNKLNAQFFCNVESNSQLSGLIPSFPHLNIFFAIYVIYVISEILYIKVSKYKF